MKRFATIMGILSILVLATSAFAQGPQYGWTISNNTTDPFSNSGTATFGVRTHYLWFNCGVGDGMAAAAFQVQAVGITLLAATAINGYLNADAAPNFLLAVGGCPTGPVVAATLLTLDSPGSMAIGPHPIDGKVTVDCQGVPTGWTFGWIGYDNTGAAPPEKGDARCEPVSVEETSWGSLKSLYR